MCFIIANLLKIVIITASAVLLCVIGYQTLFDLKYIQRDGSVQELGIQKTIWLLHCFCGILMTVLKLKDECYLYWWQLLTLAVVIGGVCINFLQPESDGFGVGQKAVNYFVLEYMLLTLLAVAYYTRALRTQEEV